MTHLMTEEKRPHNSTYPKGGVSCSKDSFVVNQTLVFQIKFCGKSPALRVAAKRCRAFKVDNNNNQISLEYGFNKICRTVDKIVELPRPQ